MKDRQIIEAELSERAAYRSKAVDTPPTIRDPIMEAVYEKSAFLPLGIYLVWYGVVIIGRLIARAAWHLGWRRRRRQFLELSSRAVPDRRAGVRGRGWGSSPAGRPRG